MPLILLVASAEAAPQPAIPPELARVRAQVSELEVRLKDLQARQADLGRQRERLETELALAAVRVKETEIAERQLADEVIEASRQVDAAQRDLTAAVDRLRSQMTLLAVLGHSGLLPLVLRAALGGEDLPRRVTVTLALVREQKMRRDELADLAARREAALAALSQRRAELDGIRGQLEARRKELADTRTRVVAELARLELRRREEASALADARESEDRLERLWGVVAQGGEEASADVRLLRGGLHWPVRAGRVVRGFGARRDPRYGTLTVSHGVTLEVPAGEQVTAIAAGRLAYAQFFKGYGNVVIVQHGGQVYSLYAQLASILARAGQRVGTGDVLGLVGPDNGGEGNFYLEVRVGQVAQDPLAWLKPAGR